jgi:hypothetical protein
MRAEQVLTDPTYEVPATTGSARPGGIIWLRATVARFSTGDRHHRRRGLAVGLLDAVDPARLRQRAHDLAAGGSTVTPVDVLAEALGLAVSAADVATVAAAYHPHLVSGPEHDTAVAALVDALGGVPDELTAARIGLLVQAHAATLALVANARGRAPSAEEAVRLALAEDPPVRVTRRVRAGETVEVDISGLPFGAGPHACPGREHAIALAVGILSGERSPVRS